MECLNCNNEVAENVRYCSDCLELLNKKDESTPNNFNQQTYGNNNYSNNGQNNSINIYEPSQNIEAYYYTKSSRTLPITTKQLQTSGGLLAIIGLVSSIITIINFFNSLLDEKLSPINGYSSLFIIILIIGVLLWSVGVVLKRKGFESFTFLFNKVLNISLNKNDQVEMLKIEGKCPICNSGTLKLIKSYNRIIGMCNKNQNHIFDFDHTTYTGTPLEIQVSHYQ